MAETLKLYAISLQAINERTQEAGHVAVGLLATDPDKAEAAGLSMAYLRFPGLIGWTDHDVHAYEIPFDVVQGAYLSEEQARKAARDAADPKYQLMHGQGDPAELAVQVSWLMLKKYWGLTIEHADANPALDMVFRLQKLWPKSHVAQWQAAMDRAEERRFKKLFAAYKAEHLAETLEELRREGVTE